MKKNVGVLDRGARTILAMVLGVLIVTGTIAGTAAIVLGVVAVLLLFTSLISFCPLYFLVRISTRKSVE
jgi:hypothetical protein